jgi:hypothetical protein
MKPITEEWTRTIDCIAKSVTALAIVVGAFWALHVYSDNRAYQLATARIEAQKPLLEKRLEFYVAVTSTTAIIATSKNETEVAKAKEEFWKLYSGPLILVQDAPVKDSMRQFGDCLQDSKRCESSVLELSRGLARSCDWSLYRDWTPIVTPPVELTTRVQ